MAFASIKYMAAGEYNLRNKYGGRRIAFKLASREARR